MFSINISQEVEEFVGERGVCKVSLAMGLGGGVQSEVRKDCNE